MAEKELIEIEPVELNGDFDSAVRYRRETIARSSLLSSLDKCRKMAFYEYVEQSDSVSGRSYVATFLGTGGHKLIEIIHKEKRFDMEIDEQMEIIEREAMNQFESEHYNLNSNVDRDKVREQMEINTLEIVQLIDRYKNIQRNKEVVITNFEQKFVIPLLYKTKNREPELIYLIGTIDQIGYYLNGELAIRDLKFRDNSYRPSDFEIELMKQLIIYSVALKRGYPICEACEPKYSIDINTGQREVVFNGICKKCSDKIGTKEWPSKYPDIRELIWMKDLNKYKRNYKSRKKGDFYGKCIYTKVCYPQMLERYFFEMIQTIRFFLDGHFERTPGDHCNMWCSRKSDCFDELKQFNPVQENIFLGDSKWVKKKHSN